MEWGPEIKVDGAKPDWLSNDTGVKLWKKSFEGVEQKDLYVGSVYWPNTDWIRLPVGFPQPSPADTVTIARMTEAEARHLARGENASWVMGSLATLRHFGLIRPATKAEAIATKTNLPLADVERVIAALGEEGL